MANLQRIFDDEGIPYLVNNNGDRRDDDFTPWVAGGKDFASVSLSPLFDPRVDQDIDYGQGLSRFRDSLAQRPDSLGLANEGSDSANANFLRVGRDGDRNSAFDGGFPTAEISDVTASFKKDYGYTPSANELIQYANLNRLQGPRQILDSTINDSNDSLESPGADPSYGSQEVSRTRGLLSRSFGNESDRDETAFDDLINGYSDAGNSEDDQPRSGQDDIKREIDLLNRRTNAIASDSKSGIISSDGKDYYLTMRDPNGLGIYQSRDLDASSPANMRHDQGANANDIQKVTVTGKRMSDQEKENYDREQMQLSMRNPRVGSRALTAPRETDSNFQSNGASFRSGSKASIGKLSERYESGGRGPGVISNGRGDYGGVSYGTFQLASKMKRPQDFLQSEGKRWAPQFGGADPTLQNGEFGRIWKNTANEDRDAFAKAQYDYIKRTHYDAAVKKIEKNTGVRINELPPAVQDVVWSTAVQHGPDTRIPTKVIRSIGNTNPNSDDFNQRFINGVYDERSRRRPNGVLEYFQNSSARDQAGVASRFIREKNDALNMLNSGR